MTDIVERLRKQYYGGHHDEAFDKATNEIARLRDALEEIANCKVVRTYLQQIARAALQEEKE